MKARFLAIVLVLGGLLVCVNESYGCPPVAILTAEPEYVMIGVNVTLDGSDSYAWIGSIVKYEWDFTNNGSYDYNETSGSAGDGVFDGNTTHAYSSVGINYCRGYHRPIVRVSAG